MRELSYRGITIVSVPILIDETMFDNWADLENLGNELGFGNDGAPKNIYMTPPALRKYAQMLLTPPELNKFIKES